MTRDHFTPTRRARIRQRQDSAARIAAELAGAILAWAAIMFVAGLMVG